MGISIGSSASSQVSNLASRRGRQRRSRTSRRWSGTGISCGPRHPRRSKKHIGDAFERLTPEQRAPGAAGVERGDSAERASHR